MGKQMKRMNIVIEGIPSGVDLYEYVLKLARRLDIYI